MKKQCLLNKRFGKLVVIGEAENIRKSTAWVCRCDCGKITNVLSYNLLKGKSKSCGCVRGEKLGILSKKHGGSKTRLYQIYKGMKQRCNNKSSSAYKYYGGRGIKVCSEWEDFIAFKTWAENNGYKDFLSIDRIDPNRGYNPANCRWVSFHKQQNNKLNSMFVIINEEKLTIAEWANKNKTNKQTLYDKFYRLLEQLGIENAEAKEFIIITNK